MASLSGRLVFFRPPPFACTVWRQTSSTSVAAAAILSVRYYSKKSDRKGPSLKEIERLEMKKQEKRLSRILPPEEVVRALEEWKERREMKNLRKEREVQSRGEKRSKQRDETAEKGTYLGLEDRLKCARGPMLLYAKFSGKFLTTIYGIATCFFAFSGYTFWANIVNAPEGLPWWVSRVSYFTVGTTALVALGLGYWPTKIIQKIYAVPVGKNLSFVLHQRPLLPLLPERKILVDSSSKIVFDNPLQPRLEPKVAIMEEPPKRSLAGRAARAVVESPFRTISAVSKLMDTNDFVGLSVDGGRYRIAKDAWVWERRGLDLLFSSRSGKYRY